MQGTALEITKQAAAELGLLQPSTLVANPVEESQQLFALLNSVGNTLVMYYDWQWLIKTQSITSVANQGAYPPPADYARMLNQTLWDKSGRRPAAGPLSPQSWQRLLNAVTMTGPFVQYRIAAGKVEFLPVPTDAGQELNYQYISDGWVQSYLDPDMRTNMVKQDNDIILFDFWLCVKMLKMKLWQSKGLDTTALASEFAAALDSLTGQDVGAPVLSVAPRPYVPYIDRYNVPDGNWVVGS
jgi:hypothetical protein